MKRFLALTPLAFAIVGASQIGTDGAPGANGIKPGDNGGPGGDEEPASAEAGRLPWHTIAYGA